MSERHFLWPHGRTWRAVAQAARFASPASIEDRLASMFQGGHPVLCSSGRSALVFALMGSGLSRADGVGVFPYASHCVLDAASRVATPQTGAGRLRIVFHQWGYVQELDLAADAIEDSADTLAVPGCRLFPGGGAFEIWSLPKILGTTGGGVLWCRDPATAERLRRWRDARRGRTVQWLLRLLGARSPLLHAWWQGGEGVSGAPSRLQTGEIIAALGEWPAIVTDRQSKIEMARPLALPWLPRSAERMPCVVPTLIDAGGEQLVLELGFSAGMRMMERVEQDGKRILLRVLPQKKGGKSCNHTCVIARLAPFLVTIGDDLIIGPNVAIRSSNHRFSDTDRPTRQQGHVAATVSIGSDVWIGANAVILPGVAIGGHAIVAAGAVVSHDVPEYAIVAGIPARVMRDRRADVSPLPTP